VRLLGRRAPGAPEANSDDEVLRRLAPSVHRWVSALIGPTADLDDVAQEALIEVAVALDRFEGRSKLSTYAHRVVVRVALRHRRRPRREEPTLDVVPTPTNEIDPERIAMSREATRRLYRALDELSDKLRIAFVLCAIEGQAHADAAGIAGCSVETLRARLKRARRELEVRLRTDVYLAPLFREERK